MKNENLNRRFLVLLVDRQIIRIFTIYLGDFQEPIEEIREEVPQRIKTEGYRPGKIQSHVRDHLVKHFKAAGEKAESYLKRNSYHPINGVFIGTHKNYFGQVSKQLPKNLKVLLKGEFIIDVDKSMGEITNKIIKKFKL